MRKRLGENPLNRGIYAPPKPSLIKNIQQMVQRGFDTLMKQFEFGPNEFLGRDIREFGLGEEDPEPDGIWGLQACLC